VVDRLAPSFTCAAVDLEDFGRSPRLTTQKTVAERAAPLAALIDELSLCPAVVVGHSLGGMVAQELALAAPGRVGALVLCNTIPRATDRVREINAALGALALEHGSAALAEAMAPGLFGPGALEGTEKARARFVADCGAADPAALAGALQAIMGFDALGRLGGVGVPALVVAGEHEPNCDDQRLLATALGRGTFAVVAGAGHMAPAEAPDAFSELVRGFLGAEAPGGARA
jgi:pimeloyl-ACP methyl ester carboxylesterase